MTGKKTNNGMRSILPGTAGADGPAVKTLLEFAEEKGLSTGVVTNMPIWDDATPAACYAHAPSRKTMVEIFSQVFAWLYSISCLDADRT